MNKEEEFIERLGLALRRFIIHDRFNKIDSNIARLAIAKHVYTILCDMSKESEKTEEDKTTTNIVEHQESS